MDLTFFGKTAEAANKYFKKGQPIFVEGRLQFDTWAAQDGTKRSKHGVIVENWQFMGGDAPKKETTRTRDAAADNAIPDSEIPF